MPDALSGADAAWLCLNLVAFPTAPLHRLPLTACVASQGERDFAWKDFFAFSGCHLPGGRPPGRARGRSGAGAARLTAERAMFRPLVQGGKSFPQAAHPHREGQQSRLG